jgi:hypothetical protein
VGIAALVLGILAIVLCIIPSFSATQLIGGLVAILAIILGIAGRRVTCKDHSTGIASAGLVLGIVALVFNAVVFASCQYCQHRLGERVREGLKRIATMEAGVLPPEQAEPPLPEQAEPPAEEPPAEQQPAR